MADSERQKVIFDTDCGIDDALALMLALSSKETTEITAVSCVFGNTSLDNVCSNVMRVLTVCGESEIPIHRGCDGPLIQRNKKAGEHHGFDGLGNCADEFSTGNMKLHETPAPAALIQYAKKHPKEITLIAIGPLTNLAVAHRIDPKFTENLKSIVIMGGNYKGIGNTTELAEYNFFCDPESAHIVLSEAICPVTLVPWETTMEYGIKWEFYRELTEIKTRKGLFFKRITKLHADLDYSMYLDCDFLAAAAAVCPRSIATSLKYPLAVECRSKLAKGLTLLLKNDIHERRKVEIVTTFKLKELDALRENMLL